MATLTLAPRVSSFITPARVDAGDAIPFHDIRLAVLRCYRWSRALRPAMAPPCLPELGQLPLHQLAQLYFSARIRPRADYDFGASVPLDAMDRRYRSSCNKQLSL
jgi:hypothetical protein